MAIVLNLGLGSSCTRIKKINGEDYEVIGYADEFNDQFSKAFCKQSVAVILSEPKKLAEALNAVFRKKEYTNEKFYVTITGLDTQYRTEAYSEQDFGGQDPLTMSEDDLMASIFAKAPQGMTDIHPKYEVCVLNYGRYAETIISSAYLPTEYVDGIKQGFADTGFTLFGIAPLSYGVYNALYFGDGKVRIIRLRDVVLMANDFGIMIWPKSKNVMVSDTDVEEFLFSEFSRVYGTDVDRMTCETLTPVTAENYFRYSMKGKIDDFNIIGALGMVLPHLEEKAEIGEGKSTLKNVTDSIRKLFEEKGNAEG